MRTPCNSLRGMKASVAVLHQDLSWATFPSLHDVKPNGFPSSSCLSSSSSSSSESSSDSSSPPGSFHKECCFGNLKRGIHRMQSHSNQFLGRGVLSNSPSPTALSQAPMQPRNQNTIRAVVPSVTPMTEGKYSKYLQSLQIVNDAVDVTLAQRQEALKLASDEALATSAFGERWSDALDSQLIQIGCHNSESDHACFRKFGDATFSSSEGHLNRLEDNDDGIEALGEEFLSGAAMDSLESAYTTWDSKGNVLSRPRSSLKDIPSFLVAEEPEGREFLSLDLLSIESAVSSTSETLAAEDICVSSAEAPVGQLMMPSQDQLVHHKSLQVDQMACSIESRNSGIVSHDQVPICFQKIDDINRSRRSRLGDNEDGAQKAPLKRSQHDLSQAGGVQGEEKGFKKLKNACAEQTGTHQVLPKGANADPCNGIAPSVYTLGRNYSNKNQQQTPNDNFGLTDVSCSKAIMQQTRKPTHEMTGALLESMGMGKTQCHPAMLFGTTFPLTMTPETMEVSRPKRRNVKISKDPQSVAARHRREKISDRIRVLQRLVPGGTKMDTASMLDEAIHYVKFLKMQLQSLEYISNGYDSCFSPMLFLRPYHPLQPDQSTLTQLDPAGVANGSNQHFLDLSHSFHDSYREQFCH